MSDIDIMNKENTIMKNLLFQQINNKNLIGGNNEFTKDDQQIIYEYILNIKSNLIDCNNNIFTCLNEHFKNKSYKPNLFYIYKDIDINILYDIIKSNSDILKSNSDILNKNNDYKIVLINKSFKLINLYNIEFNRSDILIIFNDTVNIIKFTKSININKIDDIFNNKSKYINNINITNFSPYYLLNNINSNNDIYYDIISQIEYKKYIELLNNSIYFSINIYNNIYVCYNTEDNLSKDKYNIYININNIDNIDKYIYYIIKLFNNTFITNDNISDNTYLYIINLIYNKLFINNIFIDIIKLNEIKDSVLNIKE